MGYVVVFRTSLFPFTDSIGNKDDATLSSSENRHRPLLTTIYSKAGDDEPRRTQGYAEEEFLLDYVAALYVRGGEKVSLRLFC